MRNLISSGANAIIINPADATALNPVIAEAKRRGVKSSSRSTRRSTRPRPTSSPTTRSSTASSAREWLAKKIGGKGNIARDARHHRRPGRRRPPQGLHGGIEEVPGHQGRQADLHRLAVRTGGKQALDVLQSGTKIDGIWTSGIDYSVVNALKKAGQQKIPVVGADNNKFLGAAARRHAGRRGDEPRHRRRRRRGGRDRGADGRGPEKATTAHARRCGTARTSRTEQRVLRHGAARRRTRASCRSSRTRRTRRSSSRAARARRPS